jgi:hypothetical protein
MADLQASFDLQSPEEGAEMSRADLQLPRCLTTLRVVDAVIETARTGGFVTTL